MKNYGIWITKISNLQIIISEVPFAHVQLRFHVMKQGMECPHRHKFKRCMSHGCGGKLVPSSTFYRHLTCRKLLSSPTYQLKANTIRPSFANQKISSPLVEPSSWDHEPSSPLLSTNVGTNADALGTHVGTHVDDVEPIDRLLPTPCHEKMTLNSVIANQIVELQRNMDEAKAPIAFQNKVLSQLFGGGANVVDVVDYTSMGLAQLLALVGLYIKLNTYIQTYIST